MKRKTPRPDGYPGRGGSSRAPANSTARNNIVPFRQPEPQRCELCGGPHRPRQPWHTICRHCYAWSMAAFHAERMGRALDALRGRP